MPGQSAAISMYDAVISAINGNVVTLKPEFTGNLNSVKYLVSNIMSSTAHVEGQKCVALGIGAHAEGAYSKATNVKAHAEGLNTTASGEVSHAEGSCTQATGSNSHAEGEGAQATGYNSQAEGSNTIASGECSHAAGGGTEASGVHAYASGERTTAQGRNQTVIGKFNTPQGTTDSSISTDYAFIVGNGYFNSGTGTNVYSNALTLDWLGNLWTAGAHTATQFKLSALNTAPASATDTGTAGEVRITADYIYVCVATNTWKRTALTTW